MKSILFDATFRSGNHFAVGLLKKAFPNTTIYWGYKFKHNPESFNFPKDKFNFFMTSIRNPIDSVSSQIIIQPDFKIEQLIKSYKMFLDSVLKNKEKIHIYSFEDIITKPMKVVENIATKLNINFENVDIDKLIKSFSSYNLKEFHVVPINKHDIIEEKTKTEKIKLDLLKNNFTDLIDESNKIYEDLLEKKINLETVKT
jgi:hypothetical protein|tara:strand:- start:100 stop:699 length:600 start_codon:yes stop_codon:yes gene_type:complete